MAYLQGFQSDDEDDQSTKKTLSWGQESEEYPQISQRTPANTGRGPTKSGGKVIAGKDIRVQAGMTKMHLVIESHCGKIRVQAGMTKMHLVLFIDRYV
jgi:hypothetical protein